MTGGAMASEAATEEAVFLAAKVAVWWDIDDCRVPKGCDASAIAENIKSALFKLGYHGPVTITAYGDTSYVSESVQQALSSTGVSLNHIPSGDSVVTDRKIEQLLVDLMIDNDNHPAPWNVLLISGNSAYSDALHNLGAASHNILLAASLPAAAKTVWHWNSLVVGGSPIGGGGGGGGVDALYRTSVWWDMEEFKLPDEFCKVRKIAKNIKSALFKLGYYGTVSISAYGDTSDMPLPVQLALNGSGIKLIHVPAGDKIKKVKLITDLICWIVGNPAPANILFIAERSVFYDTLHGGGYNVLLVQPSEASPLLSVAATKTVWLWKSLLAGDSPIVNCVDAAEEAKYLVAEEAKLKAAKTSVWWATEDCEIPEHCDVNAIAGNIESALLDLGYHGPVSIFAYVDRDIPESVQRAFSSTGISLKQVPAGKICIHIIADMISWPFENAAPSNILLISGEYFYSRALSISGERCNILLCTSLPAAAKTVWHWPTLLSGGSPIGSGGEALQTRVNVDES